MTRVAIIGAGFGGIGMAIRLKEAGIEDFVVLEKADDVGGTWQANTYPGCQCDVPSHMYSFSFAPNPGWTRTYSLQAEILDYLRRTAERFGVMPHVRLGCAVRDAAWDEGAARWRLETSDGEIVAQHLVTAAGPLSEPRLPDIPGIEDFAGTLFHSARWNHDHDLTGERVAVIGTGASAIQFIPHVQRSAGRLLIFQRTPPWVLPHTDRPTTPLERALYRRVPALQRAVRTAVYWARETNVVGFVHDQRVMRLAEAIARRHLRRQVPDPELRAKLTPDYRLGCKRVLLSNDYYPALTQPNVELHTERIAEVRGSVIVTADGREHEVDTIILGTGFHVTDMPAAAHIRGRDGVTLEERFGGSPRAFLGTTFAGFPNHYMLLGPNTGLGHNSVVFMIEAQIAHVLQCIRLAGSGSVEVRPEAEEAFNAEIQAKLEGTVWNTGGCASWYLDRNGVNSTIWPGGTWRFWQRVRRVDRGDYVLHPAPERVSVPA